MNPPKTAAVSSVPEILPQLLFHFEISVEKTLTNTSFLMYSISVVFIT